VLTVLSNRIAPALAPKARGRKAADYPVAFEERLQATDAMKPDAGLIWTETAKDRFESLELDDADRGANTFGAVALERKCAGNAFFGEH
jgi:hypothetical protein